MVNGSLSLVANPDTISSKNPSGNVAHLVKIANSGATEQEQQSVGLTINTSDSPLDLSIGSEFSFDIRYDSTYTNWGCNSHDVYLELVDGANKVISYQGTSMPAVCQNQLTTQPAWEHVSFDFSLDVANIGKINSVRIRIFSGQDAWTNIQYGYYIDNLQYYTNAHVKNLLNTEAKNYTITDGDSLYAVVKNKFDLSRVDTSMVYLTVKNPGIDKRGVKLADTCATEGSILKEFNLTQYNYQMGGALVANLNWFWDLQKTKPVENPMYVDVPAGTTTFYVYVDDECVDIPGKLTLDVYAIPVVQDATVTVCEQPSLGGDQGLIDLTQMKSKVTTDAAATIEWYKDEACTQLVGSLYNIPVVEGSKFYAKIYNNTACPAYATLTVDITSVDDITFT